MFAKPPGEVDHHHEVRLIRGARGLGRAPAEARQLASTSEEGGEKKYWGGVRRNREEIEKKLRRNRDEKEVNLWPTDGNGERVEGDGRRGNFCVAVPLHHTQHKPKQFVLNSVLRYFFVFDHLQQIEYFLLL